jgi:signal transduction histidine kinase
LPVVLREIAETAVRGTEIALDFEVSGIERPLETKVEAVAARVLQESMTNIIKHAEACSVRVRLFYRPRSLTLSIADDGKGFQVDPDFRAYGGHWGLLGMKERAVDLCGTLKVRSWLGQGTTVALRVPDRAPAAVAAPVA